jgi:competence protein ComEC
MIKTLRLPLIPVLFAYGFGLYLGHFDLPISPQECFLPLFLALAASWVLFLGMKRPSFGSWAVLAIFFLLGIFSIRTYLDPGRSSHHLSRFIGQDRIAVEGIVSRSPQRTREGSHLFIRSEKVILPDRHVPVEGNLLLMLEEESPPWHLGDRLRFLCRLYRPRGFRNPGGFSYERHLAFERIHTIGFLSEKGMCVRTGEGIGNPLLLMIERWRDHIRYFLETGAGFPSSTLLKALVLGEQGNIPEEVKEQFIATGTAHLLAISGDHLGIVAILSFSTLIWIMKRSEFLLLTISVRKWAAGLTLPVMLLYTLIAGASISVVRAAIMVITFFLSILLSRERNLLHTLGLAAFFILLFSPPSLFDVSFQLSFMAVFSILYLVPPLWKRWGREEISVPGRISFKEKAWRYLKLSFLVTAVAIVGTAPFVALHFNRLSPIGFVTNLLFVPWVGFLIVPLSLIASLLSFFFYPAALFLLQMDDLLMAGLLKVVGFFASVPFSSADLSTPTAAEIILFYILLLSLVHLHQRRAYRYLFVGVSLLLALDLAFWNVRGSFQESLRVTCIDVGHGDSILVEFPGGKRMLIDGGGLRSSRADIGKSVIAPFLFKKKIRRIDFLVLTHPDPDHLKGLLFVASHFSIGEFWESGIQVDTEEFRRMQEALSRHRISRHSMNDRSPAQVINGVKVAFLNPPPRSPHPGNVSSFLNNQSLVLQIQFKGIIFLFTGDIEKEAEDRILKAGYPLAAHILKVPHHGSLSSSSLPFLRSVRPDVAVLSVGERNLGRLPHPEVMRRYRELGTKVYRTDKEGAVTITTDGEAVRVESFVKKDEGG